MRRQWVALPNGQRADIRNALNAFLTTHHTSAPPFIVNKLSKLTVDVAKTDWPHFYPDFFSRVLHLAASPETMRLGLGTLLIASEELATPREDLPSGRKEELKKFLQAEVPQMLHLLTSILEAVMKRRKEAENFKTPPPSPQHPAIADNEQALSAASGSFFTSSPVQEGSLLHAASAKLAWSGGRSEQQRDRPAQSSMALTPQDEGDANEVASLALRCVAHLFTWIPISATAFNNSLIDLLFQFASLGAKRVGGQAHHQRRTELAVMALTAVNELMYRNCVPPDCEGFLQQIFRSSYCLLESVVSQEAGGQKPGATIASLDDT